MKVAKSQAFLKKLRERRGKDIDEYFEYTNDLAGYIRDLLKVRNISPSDLAKTMGKEPSEISKYLSGQHNFTFRTVAKIAIALGEKLLLSPKKAKQLYSKENVIIIQFNVEMDTKRYISYKQDKSRLDKISMPGILYGKLENAEC